jgi:predicted nucleotidyltransferase
MNDGLKPRHRETIIAELKKCPKLKKAILFGSRAMGTYTPESDIDIALEGDLNLTDQAELAEKLNQTSIPYTVDLVRTHTITDSDLKEHIRRHGKTWWERKAAADRP